MSVRKLFSLIVLVGSIYLPAATRGMLRIGIGSFPGSLNPVYATDEVSQGICNKVYQSLFYFDPSGKIRNELVRSAALDETKLEATVELKQGERFSNGREVTSDDVLATIRLLKNPAFRFPYQSDLAFIDRFEKIGLHRFTVCFRERFAPWKNYLTFKILSAAEIQTADPARFKVQYPLGSGAYRIRKIEEPARIWLEANPLSSQTVKFARIEYSVLLDPRQAPLKLISGETDAAEVDPQDAQIFLGNPKWQDHFRLAQYKKFGFTYLAFNLKNPEIDLNLRQIVYNQVMMGNFLDVFLNHSGETVHSPFLLFNDEMKPVRFGTSTLLERRRLTILTNSESRLRKNLVLFLIEELRPLHIELLPVFVEYHTFLKYLKEGRYDLAVSGFVLDIDWNLRDILAGGSFFNYAQYTNPIMDRLLDDGLREMDERKRKCIYRQAHFRWREDLPFIPLFTLYYYMGLSKRLTTPRLGCPVVGSTGDFFYHLEEWGD